MELTEKPSTLELPTRTTQWLSSTSKVLALFAGYFLLQILLRLITSRTTDLDESEQLLATQQLQWGYGPQPPLFTWLLFPLVQALGPGVLAIAILKNALLFGLYAVTYASARLVIADRLRSAVVALSLLFLPQIAWESQRDLSHSVLVTFLAALAFLIFLNLNRRKSWALYAAFGLCLGAGVLAKYSFLIFAVGLLIGAISVRSKRSVILHPGMLLSLLIAVAIVAPHVVWAMHHADWTLATSSKLKIAAGRPWLETTVLGVRNLLTSIASHLAPLILIYWVLAGKRFKSVSEKSTLPDGARVIKNSLLAMLGILLTGIVCFKVTGFKDRWLMPLCVWTPILLVAFASARLSVARLQRLAWLAFTIALAIAVLIPLRVRFARSFGFAQALNAPYAKLVRDLPSDTTHHSLVFASDNWVGGNLKLQLPQKFVASPRIFLSHLVTNGTECLLVWDATKNELARDRLFSAVSRVAEIRTNEIRHVEAPLSFWPDRKARLGFTTCRFKINTSTALEQNAEAAE